MASAPPRRPPPPRPTSLTDVLEPHEEFEKVYKDAYAFIDKGITLVTENQHSQAEALLQRGLVLLDRVINMKVETFQVSPEQIQLYTEMQLKMRGTKKQVLAHFSDSQVLTSCGTYSHNHDNTDAPPTYDDYLQSLNNTSVNNSIISRTTPAVAALDSQTQETAFAEIMAQNTPLSTPATSPQNGEMIFTVENGVQIFFIYPDGRVTSPSYPSFLSVFTFPNPIGADSTWSGARGFIQVGEWSYPLVPAHSPVLHSFYGAYMFPDASNSIAGTNVGIIVPDTVSKDQRELFEQILTQMTSYEEQKVPEGVDAEHEQQMVTQSASERIATGAEAVSKGVVRGAGKLGELVTFGSSKLQESIRPEANQVKIDPKWQKTAEIANNVSGKAVKVSGFLLSQVGKATMALGQYMAPHIQRHGTKAITHFTGQKEEEANVQLHGAMEVAAGALKGAGTVYMGLENAAAILAKSLTDNTVKVVSHKYGSEAGALTDNTLYAVGQTAMAGHNVAALGVKGIAKRTAKDAGKALVYQYDGSKKENNKIEQGKEAKEEEDEFVFLDDIEKGAEALPPKKTL